jgi:hypothetical protein
MDAHGILLTPEAYEFSSYLHANISTYDNPDEKYGLSIYKSGLSILGMSTDKSLSASELKNLTASLTYKIPDTLLPILNEGQQTLLSAILQTDKDLKTRYKIKSYSLITCEESPFDSSDPEEMLNKQSIEIEILTDWIISWYKLPKGILFIGMAGSLYIGNRDTQTDSVLRRILYLQTLNNLSHYLHSLLWSVRKQLQNLKESGKEANYKVLKSNNEHICVLNDLLAKIEVYDHLLQNETHEIAEKWKSMEGNDEHLHRKIRDKFSDEIEKSTERGTTIEQLKRELEVLSSELENRLELIMTRDTMTLNIILLVLTVISVLGIGEIVGFDSTQWLIVAVVIVPFGAVSIWYLRNFLKNFHKQ